MSRPPASSAPLSHCQSRVWFLRRIDPEGDAYHETSVWRIDGPLDAGALRIALDALAARHPMLRTRFPTVDGEPRQQVDADARTDLAIVDLAGEAEPEQRLALAIRELERRPFDLGAAPPIRWALHRLGPDRHVLARVWHHILGDAQSGAVLADDLTRAYAAAAAGRSPALDPLPVDYIDYSEQQRRDLASPRMARAFDHWRRRLAGAPTLALPADYRRPATQSFRGAVRSARLGRDAVDALAEVARSAGASSFVAALTAFAVLLSRLSGDEDIVVGTPVGGRPGPEYADVVGFFANTLPIRLDLSGSPSFAEALRRAAAAVREDLEHQALPFDTLVDSLGVARDPSRNPLFQVAFARRRQRARDLEFPGAKVERVETDGGRARFDLTMTLADDADGAEIRIEYCTALFAPETIERMAGQYATLVASIGRAPAAPIGSLALMDDATRDRVVRGAIGRVTPGTGASGVAERFAAQAAATPSAPAIDGLVYEALDAASSRLSAELRARGVSRGAFVGVARSRARDVATAWIAVLKAGAAYVPIDPDLPVDRVAAMLEDAGVRVVVADDVAADRFARFGVDVVTPERDAARIAAHDATLPIVPVPPDAPACAFYTSGSSGRPKGVAVPHRSIVRLVCGTDYVALGPGDVVAQIASPAFDASTFEFWGALLNGARVAPIPKSTAIAPRALAAAIARERVSALFLTTALFNSVARDAPEAFRSCDAVLFGGEAVEPRWVAAVLRAGAPKRLLHVYGPTETTTFATWHEVGAVPLGATTIPIGKAIANAEAYVLRPDGEPAAPGEPGEIVIGGSGVAIGYLGERPGESDRFVVAGIAGLPPRRLYRTGDRARLRDDGAIEFLGRDDRQVKLRGHRIELDEVESAIAGLPGIREAVVLLRGDTSESRRLVVYAVPRDANAAPPENLWRELRPRLPEFMMPSAIVWLPSLPLNASGKVDRAALPAADESHALRPGTRVAPRDMLESLLVRLWEQLLGRRDIGVYDHLFEIGGHSLLAARLVDEIERATGTALPITALLLDDTIAGMARALREGKPSGNANVVAIHEDGARPPFVFLHGDFNGGGFYSRALAQALGDDQPTIIVHPHGLDDRAIPETIEAMAAERVAELRALWPRGPYVVGGHCNGAATAFEMARQLAAQGEEVPAIVVVEAPPPLHVGATDDDVAAFRNRYRVASVEAQIPRDRASDTRLRFQRAMEAYRGRPSDLHLAIIRAEMVEALADDADWARLAPSHERIVLPGGHMSMLTRHVGELSRAIRGVIDRATAAGRGGARSGGGRAARAVTPGS